MSTVLSNGVIVPDVGSTNWASDLETNWTLLNALIGAVGANVRLDRPNIWTAAQTFSEGIYGDLDGTAAMAVSDANGNEIATTYALKTEVTALQTAVATKAADSAVVHLAGAETITGDKTWTGNNAFTHDVSAVTDQTVPIAENPSAEIVGNNFRFIDNARFWGQFVPVWGTDGSFRIDLGISNWTTSGAQGYWSLSTKISKDFGTLSFYTSHSNANLGTPANNWNTVWTQALRAPGTSGALILAAMETWEDGARIFMYGTDYTSGSAIYADVDHGDANHTKTGLTLVPYAFFPVGGGTTGVSLGDSTNKWKSLNGINPGALSLPSHSVYIDISSSITHTDWTVNYYTPTINGYIALNINGCAIIQPYGVYGISAGFYDDTVRISDLRVCLPVIANQTYEIWVLGTVNEARLFACLGNV